MLFLPAFPIPVSPFQPPAILQSNVSSSPELPVRIRWRYNNPYFLVCQYDFIYFKSYSTLFHIFQSIIVLKFSYHCYSEATRFSHAYIFSPRCKIPHSFENFYNFIYQTTLLSRISCDTISTQNRKLFSTFIVTRKIYSRSASLTGFLPSSLCFLMVSAANAQTC